MSEKIIYDFVLSKSVCDSLEELAQQLNTEIIDKENDTLSLLAGSWNAPEAELFAQKYSALTGDVKKLRDEINGEAERIKLVSRKMYLLEQEAKKTIEEKGI